MGVFHDFKLYKWSQIAQIITYIGMNMTEQDLLCMEECIQFQYDIACVYSFEIKPIEFTISLPTILNIRQIF